MINLNGKSYELKTRATKRLLTAFDNYNNSVNASIWDAYENPSRTKAGIYNEYNTTLDSVAITTFNIFQFTMGGTVRDTNGVRYFVYITKSKNEAIPFEVLKEAYANA